MGNNKIRIGTRGSKLALWQADYVSDRLKMGGIETETMIIETKGDKMYDVTIGNIGGKGVFTEEIEEQLQQGNIDIAIHSAKDMPSELPEGLELISFTKREKVNDVLISNRPNISVLHPEKDWLIGTSSTRRVALLKHYCPILKTISVRGNLQTRIRKMQQGQCDALLLAFAGVHRMNMDNLIVEILPNNVFTTPAGQGTIAVEASKELDRQKKKLIRELVNHNETEICVRAERTFMKILQGGCSIPVFVLAQILYGHFHIQGGIISLDGKKLVREKLIGKVQDHIALAEKIGKFVLKNGGKSILQKIKGDY